jgi:hypothetical protein
MLWAALPSHHWRQMHAQSARRVATARGLPPLRTAAARENIDDSWKGKMNGEGDTRADVVGFGPRWGSPRNSSLVMEGASMWKGRLRGYEQSGAADRRRMRHRLPRPDFTRQRIPPRGFQSCCLHASASYGGASCRLQPCLRRGKTLKRREGSIFWPV